MKILGLDTATLTAGIAIVDAGRIVAQAQHDTSGRSADLLVGIDAVCRTAGIAPGALDAIAIGAGPGSFTGLRIGMATAKGIAFAAGRPLWAVSSLAALAHDATLELANQQRSPYLDGVIIAALDARKGEVYAGCYRADGSALGVERVLAPDELAAWATELAGDAPQRFAGDALTMYPDALATLAPRWLAVATPSGASVAQLAVAGARVDVVIRGAPSYVRRPEAEVMYPDGVPGALPRKR